MGLYRMHGSTTEHQGTIVFALECGSVSGSFLVPVAVILGTVLGLVVR